MRPDRPHQTRAIRMVGDALRAAKRAPLLQMPTGAGKTHVGARLADIAIRQGKRVLWLAHRDELVHQPKARLLADGWPVEQLCVIQAGRWSGNRDAPFTIASIQTLLARGICPPADVVVFDEARHYVAKDWHGRLASRYAEAKRIGLDATPQRSDGKPLGDLFDELIVPTSVRELTEAGYLAPSVVLSPAEQQTELADDPVDAYQRHTPGARAIVFAGSVAYAHSLAARFRDACVTAEAIDAKSDEDARGGALQRFISGETRVVTNVRILTEGTDLPCEVVIHASTVASLADWIQKGGRGLRPGKARCTILDLCGSFHTWGFLDDPHEFSLSGRAIKLSDSLPPIAQCPKCYAWGRSRAVCRLCGHTLPEVAPKAPRIKAADLQEQRRTDSESVRRDRLLKWALGARRAGQTGKSLWRIAHVFKGTYGEDAPRAWVEDAIAESARVTEKEQRKRDDEAMPLLARMGGNHALDD